MIHQCQKYYCSFSCYSIHSVNPEKQLNEILAEGKDYVSLLKACSEVAYFPRGNVCPNNEPFERRVPPICQIQLLTTRILFILNCSL